MYDTDLKRHITIIQTLSFIPTQLHLTSYFLHK